MYSLRQLLVALCFLAQFFVVTCVGVFIVVILGLHYDEMHTISTAMDTDPSLTRDQVISNVSIYTLGWSVATAITAALIFAVNWPLLEAVKDLNGKKAATIFALICWGWMMFFVLYAGLNCYLDYGANLPA